MRINICGIKIDNFTMKEAIDEVCKIIDSKKTGYIVTPNVDHVVKIQKDKDFKKIYDNATLVFADGVPLLWAAKFLGTPLKEKISGSDFFPEMCKTASEKNYKVFFMGGREGAADKAAEVMTKTFPKLKVCGTYCPPFGFEKDEEENNKIIKMLKKAKPDILFVGLGAPKQEKWVCKYMDKINIPISAGIGVTFEFTAGMVKRAPVWMQKVGLEWFWRLVMEPRRLWRRYLVEDPKFFWLLLKQKFSKNK